MPPRRKMLPLALHTCPLPSTHSPPLHTLPCSSRGPEPPRRKTHYTPSFSPASSAIPCLDAVPCAVPRDAPVTSLPRGAGAGCVPPSCAHNRGARARITRNAPSPKVSIMTDQGCAFLTRPKCMRTHPSHWVRQVPLGGGLLRRD
jgi:hypothetical protein